MFTVVLGCLGCLGCLSKQGFQISKTKKTQKMSTSITVTKEYLMAVLQFTNDYTEMRTLQDEYFRTRNQETLKQCKALERALDKANRNIHLRTGELIHPNTTPLF